MDLCLILPMESIHEREEIMVSSFMNYLIDRGVREVVNVDADYALIFINRDRIMYP
jgi:hypothetical protein